MPWWVNVILCGAFSCVLGHLEWRLTRAENRITLLESRCDWQSK